MIDQTNSLVTANEQSKVQIAQLNKQMQEKDKKLKIWEEKINDLQEENLQQIKKSQSELAGQKQGYEHQVAEFKKRIEELDQSGTTDKSQLANQQSLQAQQEQISKNEIQKLQNQLHLRASDYEKLEKEMDD